MASTPLVPIFKLIPSRGLPYVPVRPVNADSLNKKASPSSVVTPVKVSLRRGYSDYFSS